MPRQYLTADEFRTRKFFSMPNRQYDNSALDEYLQVATANVEAYCERIFAQQTYTEKFRGDGSTTHLVYEYPIQSVTSLQEVTLGTAPITTSYTVGNLILDDLNKSIGRVELDTSTAEQISAFRGDAIYTLVYVGGLSEIPVVVKHATGLWCAELLRMDYGSTSQSPEIVPLTSQQIVELLQPLRRRRIG